LEDRIACIGGFISWTSASEGRGEMKPSIVASGAFILNSSSANYPGRGEKMIRMGGCGTKASRWRWTAELSQIRISAITSCSTLALNSKATSSTRKTERVLSLPQHIVWCLSGFESFYQNHNQWCHLDNRSQHWKKEN
jgi:hypothetical protein